MELKENVSFFQKTAVEKKCTVVAVSKTQSPEVIRQVYDLGIRDFGENKVQELIPKKENLPSDIRWHFIGHLQSNKIKYIAPFIHLIHSVDSLKLLKEINKEAAKNDRILSCLLQIHIAIEESKFGFSFEEALKLLESNETDAFKSIKINGLMGMASFTENKEKVRSEFSGLKSFFEQIRQKIKKENVEMKVLSMGMSGDYQIALEEGSTLIRVGTSIFGERHYH